MRVCLVGHHLQSPYEGVRSVTYYLGKELAKHHVVVKVCIDDISEWPKVAYHRPHIIHLLLGPASVWSFVATKIISNLYRPAKTILSALQPRLPHVTRWARLLKPDLVVVQSRDAERSFSAAGCKAVLIPNGVDLHKYTPISPKRKQQLRCKYGIPSDKFVILHVGSIKRGRNVTILGPLQGRGRQVLLVGRPGEAADTEILESLRKLGCKVWTRYFTALEEIYGLSDCYVFPCTSRHNSIDLPLSVLEAMSCNLPVVTTRFGGLPDFFTEGEGLIYVEDEESLLERTAAMSRGAEPVATRQKVLAYSWQRIAERFGELYEELTLPSYSSAVGIQST
ncbi:MAG TPA: glycosyltransferase family 4 protein [Thermoflexia bacterium]|jgi:glycosyltransferase involved in cell wall biosynthesis|nr:glycosyltransferase family 4 protein [Thermoflexia bacterium]